MRRANPFTRFFTKGLYPGVGIGDAFWGYHVANNIARLLNVDATLYFRAPEPETSGQETSAMGQVVVMAIGDLKLTVPPVVQFTSAVEYNTSYGTLLIYGINSGWGTLEYTLDDPTESAHFYLSTSVNEGDYGILQGGDNWWGVLGNELIDFNVETAQRIYNSSYDTYSWVAYCNFSPNGRGLRGSPVSMHMYGTPLLFVPDIFNPDYVSATTLSFNETRHIINPWWVQGVISGENLVVTWLHPTSGTVYVKIFGA